MSFQVRLAPEAEQDLLRLFDSLLKQDVDLFEIEDARFVTILAVRRQREEDYH